MAKRGSKPTVKAGAKIVKTRIPLLGRRGVKIGRIKVAKGGKKCRTR